MIKLQTEYLDFVVWFMDGIACAISIAFNAFAQIAKTHDRHRFVCLFVLVLELSLRHGIVELIEKRN